MLVLMILGDENDLSIFISSREKENFDLLFCEKDKIFEFQLTSNCREYIIKFPP